MNVPGPTPDQFVFLFAGTTRPVADLQRALSGMGAPVDHGPNWVFCASGKLPGSTEPAQGGKQWQLIVGSRHENGDGLFCVIERHLSPERISFQTDALPGCPVFWYSLEGTVLVSSGLRTLVSAAGRLGVRLEIDVGAASELLIASYVFSHERTLIRGVKVTPPRSRLAVDLASLQAKFEELEPPFEYASKLRSWDGCLRDLRERLIAGSRRYKGRRVAVMLSGGADSRVVAASAVAAGLKPDFFTFGQSTVNASDFSIAAAVSHRLGNRTNYFPTDAGHFRTGWKEACATSNWQNDSAWWAGRLPPELYERLVQYDVVLRGDGDGIYGWKGTAVDVSDILHMIEIASDQAVYRSARFFRDATSVFGPGLSARQAVVESASKRRMQLRDLKNVLYQEIRERHCVAPSAWHISTRFKTDAPLLWRECIDVASRLPVDRRTNKQVIFGVIGTYPEAASVPYSSGPSWNDRLDLFLAGVWEELIDFSCRWSPWELDRSALEAEFLKPPGVEKPVSVREMVTRDLRADLLQNGLARRIAVRMWPQRAGASLDDRIVVRLALIGSIRELLAESIKTSKQ